MTRGPLAVLLVGLVVCVGATGAAPMELLATRTPAAAAGGGAAARAGAVSGRVVFLRSANGPVLDHTTVRVSLTPVRGADGAPVIAPVLADGTWALTNVDAGTYGLQAVLPPAFAGWWLQSARMGDRELLDEALAIGSSVNLPDVVLTFSDRQPSLIGSVRTGAGAPLANQAVLLFPAASDLRASPRRVAWTRSSATGEFELLNLPPGDYWLAILDSVTPGDLIDDLFFDVAAARARKVTIPADDPRVRVDLQIQK